LITFKFWTVTFSLPIWPAIFIPLKTLAGYEAAPIEPGALNLLCCPCVDWPTPAKPCLLTTPWNPFPLEVPEISTNSPSLKWSTLRTSPTLSSFSKFLNSKRLLDIYSSSSKTIDALMKLELPSGVEVEIKV